MLSKARWAKPRGEIRWEIEECMTSPKGSYYSDLPFSCQYCQLFWFVKRSWISGFLNEKPQSSNTENDLKIKKKKSVQANKMCLWSVASLLTRSSLPLLNVVWYGPRHLSRRHRGGRVGCWWLMSNPGPLQQCQQCLLVLSGGGAGQSWDIVLHCHHTVKTKPEGGHVPLKPGGFSPGHTTNHFLCS